MEVHYDERFFKIRMEKRKVIFERVQTQQSIRVEIKIRSQSFLAYASNHPTARYPLKIPHLFCNQNIKGNLNNLIFLNALILTTKRKSKKVSRNNLNLRFLSVFYFIKKSPKE